MKASASRPVPRTIHNARGSVNPAGSGKVRAPATPVSA